MNSTLNYFKWRKLNSTGKNEGICILWCKNNKVYMNYFYLLLHYQIRFDHKFTTCRKRGKKLSWWYPNASILLSIGVGHDHTNALVFLNINYHLKYARAADDIMQWLQDLQLYVAARDTIWIYRLIKCRSWRYFCCTVHY